MVFRSEFIFQFLKINNKMMKMKKKNNSFNKLIYLKKIVKKKIDSKKINNWLKK